VFNTTTDQKSTNKVNNLPKVEVEVKNEEKQDSLDDDVFNTTTEPPKPLFKVEANNQPKKDDKKANVLENLDFSDEDDMIRFKKDDSVVYLPLDVYPVYGQIANKIG